jgi:hypothetical protein
MKLIDVFDILNIRSKLIDKKLPIKTSYKLNRLFNELEVESKFFNETLEKIIDEYGQKDEAGNFILTDNGQGVKIKEEKFSECKNKIDELNNVEIHLDYEPVFSLDELDGLDLEMKYINLLIPFISEN